MPSHDLVRRLDEGAVDLAVGVVKSLTDAGRLLFSGVSLGRSRLRLFARRMSPFGAGDLRSADGCVIGVLDGYDYSEELAQFSAAGATVRFRAYPNDDALDKAFAVGEIPLVLADDGAHLPEVKTLWTFPPVPLVIAAAKSNAELMTMVDRTMIDCFDEDPLLWSRMRLKYFSRESQATLLLTSDEKAWIEKAVRANRAFTVDVSPEVVGDALSHGGGAYTRGFLGLYVNELSNLTGLDFLIMPPVSEKAAAERFRHGMTAVWLPYGATSVPTNLSAAASFAEYAPQAFCTRRNSGVDYLNASGIRVAVLRDDIERIAAYRRLNHQVVECPSPEACIQAVLDSHADGAVMHYRTARRFAVKMGVNDRLDVRLAETLKYEPEMPVLVGPTVSPQFASVIGKAVRAIPRSRIVELIHLAESREAGSGAVSREQMLKIAVGFLFVLVVVVVLMTYLYRRRIVAALEKSEELRALAESSLNDARRANEAAAAAVERAELAAKTRANFLATVSHEIRTPLNAVVGYSEFLSMPGTGPDKVIEYARGISYSANALLSLINDVLDLSKFESGRTEGLDIRVGSCDVAALGREMQSVFAFKAKEKNISVSISVAPGIRRLKLDEGRLRQIVLNLIGNAVKFTDNGGVTVTVEYGDGTFTLVVQDTGIGISPRGLKLIFDPFAQDMDSRRGKVYSGTGLGLSIVKRLVEASGGAVLVNSELGRGSTFTVVIPGVATVAEEASSAAATVAVRPDGRVENVVIVDDIEINRKILAMYCKSLKIPDVRTFASGDEVLAHLATGAAVDLVLSDLWMPGMDGSELSRRIAESRPGLPVVVVTADTDATATFDMSHFTATLTKPVTVAKLRQLIADLRHAETAGKTEGR